MEKEYSRITNILLTITRIYQYIYSRNFREILIYCLCLLEREWSLKNPDLPIIGNSPQETFLLANPKIQFSKKILIQKEQILSVYIQKQKTRMRIHIFFLNTSARVYGSPPKPKDWVSFQNKTSKGQLGSRSIGTSVRTHQSHDMCWLPSYECTLVVLEVPHSHPKFRSPFYQESGIF